MKASIVPVLVTNHTVTIAVELVRHFCYYSRPYESDEYLAQENSRTLVGQCNISHPVQAEQSISFSLAMSSPIEELDEVDPRRASMQRTRSANLDYSKGDGDGETPLESRIAREFLLFSLFHRVLYSSGLYYINAYGHEIHPSPNAEFLSQCTGKDILVYSCGSLWTRSVYATTVCSGLNLKFHV